MGWAGWLVAALGPSLKQFLLSLGVGFLVYQGGDLILGRINSAVGNAWSGIGADSYAILAMSGAIDAVNIWLSAAAVIVSLLALRRLAVVA